MALHHTEQKGVFTMSTTYTSAGTHTVTVSASDVREVMRQITGDIRAVCQAAAQATKLLNLDETLLDVSIMVLNGLIQSVHLYIEINHIVIREYRFRLSDELAGAPGPPAGQPPLGYVPPCARLRLGVSRDPRVPEAEYQTWIKQLGWGEGEALTYATGTRQMVYGSFRSGGLAVERTLKMDPTYDKRQP